MIYSPMLAKTGDTRLLAKKNFIFEPKLDGIRAIYSDGVFYGRYGQRLKFKPSFKVDAVLDGEIVAYNSKGNPDFNLLQSGGEFTYVAFDIISLKGKDLASLSLIERKKILSKTLKSTKNIQVNFYTKEGKKLFAFAKKRGIEGVMAKDFSSPYISGRNGLWQKIKLFKTVDAVVIGKNEGKRSLKVGLYDNGKLVEVGNVTVTENILKKLKHKVVEVKYIEYNKLLRAPVFLRFRDDKKPSECTIDQLVKK